MRPSPWTTVATARLISCFVLASGVLSLMFVTEPFIGAGAPVGSAIYTHGVLRVALPYHAEHRGPGTLRLELLDPEDRVLAQFERSVGATNGSAFWRGDLKP